MPNRKTDGLDEKVLEREAIAPGRWPRNEPYPKGYSPGQVSRDIYINGVKYAANTTLLLPENEIIQKYLK